MVAAANATAAAAAVEVEVGTAAPMGVAAAAVAVVTTVNAAAAAAAVAMAAPGVPAWKLVCRNGRYRIAVDTRESPPLSFPVRRLGRRARPFFAPSLLDRC